MTTNDSEDGRQRHGELGRVEKEAREQQRQLLATGAYKSRV